MNNYIQVVDGVIVGIQQSARPIESPNLVPVADYDASLIGRTWDGSKPGAKVPPPPSPMAVPDWLETLTEAEYTALETRADSDYLVRQFLKVCELRGFVDPESDLTAAALSRIGAAIAPGKRPPVVVRGG